MKIYTRLGNWLNAQGPKKVGDVFIWLNREKNNYSVEVCDTPGGTLNWISPTLTEAIGRLPLPKLAKETQ